MGAFVTVFIIGVAIFIFFGIMKQSRLADESWGRVARTLSMRPSRGGLFRRRSMSGRLHGFPVRVWTFTQSSGSSSHTYTRFEVKYPPLRLGLQLEHQGFVSRVTRFFGAQDHLIGHPLFDDNVVVKGRNVRDIKAFLTPERRVRILRTLESFPGLVIMDSRLVYTARGLITSSERLERTVRRLCDLARVLAREPEKESTFSRGLSAQREGRLDEALDLVHRAASRKGGDVDAKVVEGEILLSSGQYEDAARVLGEVETAMPEDAQVVGLAATARQLMDTPPVARRPKKLVKRPREIVPPPPPPPAEPDTPPEPPPPVPTLAESGFIAPEASEAPEERPPDDPVPVAGSEAEPEPEGAAQPEPDDGRGPVDVAAISEELFGPEARTFEGTRIFEETYAGRPVRWSGTLNRVDSYYRDMVFGEGPGSRANVLVHEVGAGTYGGREVQAVVQLPEGEDDALRDRRGETITFEGVLVRCDTFMRNLFVAEGRLVEDS